MQYPHIQFYRGSLVRLASGRLKQVEDLSSDDFVDSQIIFDENDDHQIYIDSSVVRDFLEVDLSSSNSPPSSSSSSSSLLAAGSSQQNTIHNLSLFDIPVPSNKNKSSRSCPQTPSPSSPNQLAAHLAGSTSGQPQTVLIKFFLESSRKIVFIEVPIEHPFFVFHRGWSSCNPQRTYDKFGLKCRKLKIGDTCISLIKRRKLNHN